MSAGLAIGRRGGSGTGATPSGRTQGGATRRGARGWTGEAAAARSGLASASGVARRGTSSRSRVTLMASSSFDRSWKRVITGQPNIARIAACSSSDPQKTAPFLNRVLRAFDWGKDKLDRNRRTRFATASGETVSSER
jgi:hypothetical protein